MVICQSDPFSSIIGQILKFVTTYNTLGSRGSLLYQLIPPLNELSCNHEKATHVN